MWYIGQEIVCIKSHSEGAVIKDKVYVIKAISGCKCGTNLDVGITDDMDLMECYDCGFVHNTGRVWWLDPILFAPLDSLMKEEIEELMKVETIFGVKI